MSKVGLIIKREYLTRVTSKTFILATFLTPILIGLFSVVVGKIMTYKDKSKKEHIAIIDEGKMLQNLKKTETLDLFVVNETLAQAKEKIGKDYTGVLMVPALAELQSKKMQTTLYTANRLSLELSSDIQSALGRSVKQYKVAALKLDTAAIAALDTRISINSESLNAADNKKNSSKAAAIGAMISIILGTIMYIIMFIYGNMVMRSVMEEKTSRIVEVMISSVKPFELMLGKIVGVGLVGLTQMVAWGILTVAIFTGISSFLGVDAAQMQTAQMGGGMTQAQMQTSMQDMEGMGSLFTELARINWWYILPLYLFYFLCGYFLYASLYAAVGSAVGDDLGEAQSLTIPITLPIIMGLYIAIAASRDPDSPLAFWASMFPFFSPFVMPARLIAEPPMWQILLSSAILIATVVGLIWISGRIYRVGILMYGKKASLKELAKWVFYKD
ncbi:MAG: hypothetical protein RL757_946 [Bacteroidota bacterium]|jgi:ABC-2 type transport system permease protein